MVTAIPAIGAEVLDAKIRGTVGSLTNVSLQLSMVLSNVVQFFISSNSKFYPVSVVLPSVFALLMIIICFMLKEGEGQKKVKVVNDNLMQRKYVKTVIVAVSLGMSIGATGLNPILQYSTIIFKDTFNSPKSGTIGSIITSSLSFIFSIVVIPMIKKYKRKSLFILGLNLILICQLTIIITLYLNPPKKTQNGIILGATFAFIFCYAFSSGSLFFVIMGEVFPVQVKTICVNIVMGVNLITLLITTFIFPLLKQQENYLLYVCWVILVQILIIVFIPETHNKTLEQIEMEMIPEEFRTKYVESMQVEHKDTITLPKIEGLTRDELIVANDQIETNAEL
ncbi:Hexose_transporter [Hexamita inflata]|uniref:Hexose_transporter n=1 Tax=Hexamita inflata TaxID=28002 RepID=A0ABP1K294_9EUKA